MDTTNGLRVPTGWGTADVAPRPASVREQRRCGQPVGGGRFQCPALGTITLHVAVAGHEDRAVRVRCCSGHLIATVQRYEDDGMVVWDESC
jgi:hypothetical protein